MIYRKLTQSRFVSRYNMLGMGLLIYGSLICLLLLPSSATCANAVLEGLDPQQRIWQDGSHHYYNVIRHPDGSLQIDDLHSGAVYRYTHSAGKLRKWPANAPDIDLQGSKLQLGDVTLQPVPHEVQTVTFERDGTVFHGLLTLPQQTLPAPLIISAHGSGKDAATTYSYDPSLYLQAGYATLIFDKRGTGESGGRYSHNFRVLADDLNAAFRAMRRHPRIDPRHIGFYGPSQGVYVSTLAASQNPDLAFLIEAFGVLETPLMEDEMETRQMLAAAYPDIVWADFAPFVRACGQAFALGRSEQWDTVRKLKKHWRNKVDGKTLRDTLTGDGCLSWPPFILRLIGRSQLPPQLDWAHDTAAIAEQLDIPTLWLYAGADRDAPSASSIRRVRRWQQAGKPFTLKVYPRADHGMQYWSTDTAGQRIYTREPAFFHDQLEWLQQMKSTAASNGR